MKPFQRGVYSLIRKNFLQEGQILSFKSDSYCIEKGGKMKMAAVLPLKVYILTSNTDVN